MKIDLGNQYFIHSCNRKKLRKGTHVEIQNKKGKIIKYWDITFY